MLRLNKGGQKKKEKKKNGISRFCFLFDTLAYPIKSKELGVSGLKLGSMRKKRNAGVLPNQIYFYLIFRGTVYVYYDI